MGICCLPCEEKGLGVLSALCPGFARSATPVAMIQHGPVRSFLSPFHCGLWMAGHCPRNMVRFPEVDLNTPTVSMFGNDGVRTALVDSLVATHEIHGVALYGHCIE
jgi:hypothetical protein